MAGSIQCHGEPGRASGKTRIAPPAGSRPYRAGAYRARPLPAMRCFRCGGTFPVTDFIATGKSGLCTSCWDAKAGGRN